MAYLLEHTNGNRIERSNELWERARALIPCGTQTLAKGPSQYSDGVAPKYLVRGQGAHVWDADGNEFLDYNMALGPLILGYCHPVTDAAIARQLQDGITFSLMHPLEVQAAELLRECVPNTESVRFSKTGCDATSAAVRMARAFTGREKILCCGYHGWHDWYAGLLPHNGGVPHATRDLTRCFRYNDIDSVVEALDGDTACIILEPFAFEREQNDFLSELRQLCDRTGTLLIFDEMWTGFRCALGGAQELFGVRADLALFSKAMANGMPVSAVTGRRDVMKTLEENVFFFTTFGGETLSLAAAVACIEFIRDNDVTGHITALGEILIAGLKAIIDELDLAHLVWIEGYPCRTQLVFCPGAGTDPLAMKTLVQQTLIDNGILWSGMHALSYSHARTDIDGTLAVYRTALATLADAIRHDDLERRLRGRTLEPPFKTTQQR